MGLWARYFAWSDRNRLAVDAATAALVGLVVVPTSAVAEPFTERYGETTRTGLTVLVALVMVGALAFRRTRPALAVAVVYAAALLHLLLGVAVILPADLLVPWALWSVTVHGPRWAHRVAIGGALVGSVTVGAMSTTYTVDRFAVTLLVALVFLTTWSVALARRARREALDSLIDRASRLEVERDQQATIGAAAERARIAREMHDIVAHSLSVIIAQADGGRYAGTTDPAAASRALTTISETGRAALTDMRRLLGVLRTDRPTDAAAGPPTGPLPVVDDVGALVEQLRTGGMRVSLVRLGEPRTLPPGVGLAVFRIAQESLTNVLKHAGPDPQVTVVLQWLPDTVVLEVSDDGRGAAADSDGLGQGLLGMRERATMFGGDVSAGPRTGGGFRVRATVPVPRAPGDPARAPDREEEPE